MKVENDAIWEKFVKEGSVKGFSIEGYFTNRYEMARATIKQDARYTESKLKELDLLSALEIELGLHHLEELLKSKE